MSTETARRPIYKRIGPGLITACVVIGPGSILTSSTVGANNGYSMLWVVVVSVIFMMVYMTMGARLGVVASAAPGDLIREKAGNWLSILVGLCVFFISAAFQSGNSLGVGAAFESFFDNPNVVAGMVVLFNAVAIAFLFAFRNLYQVLERLMMCFVGLMLLSFAVNLIKLGPDPVEFAQGFIPQPGSLDINVLGLVGTTFVITAAFYQGYLVRQKGWGLSELKDGLIDARVGAVIMAVITIMLMSTAAAGLYTGEPVQFKGVVGVAASLEATFGPSAKLIFCFGLFSAAYSSFLVNSMIGGFMCADGLGLGSKPTDLWPRIMTAVVLLTGMCVALASMLLGFDRTPTIIAAQAVTVVGAPLVAGVLLWLTSRREIMGDQVNSQATTLVAGIGLILLLAMAARTALVSIPASLEKMRSEAQTVQPEDGADSRQE
ncbi:MAG: Nramp family divalent metal transporter [Planctomycetota bacterium]|jgi:Mn2+/Fe2+ NRAMP family transporter